MQFKHLLLSAVFAGCALSGMAQEEGNYLYVRTATGYEVLNLDKVDRLTFSGGIMTASDKDNKTVATFPQDQIDKMYVSETAGITSVAADNAEPTFKFDATTAVVTMLADGDFNIYDTAGASLIGTAKVKKGETIALSGMEPGIVILKSGNYTVKAILK